MPKGSAYEWTSAMHRFCDSRRDMLRRELAEAFNANFGTDRSYDAIRNFCKRNGYHTGRTGCFAKGGVSHNKGMKGWSPAGSEATRFRPSNRPGNAMPVGSEIKCTPKPTVPGYWKVKIAEPNTWQFKHRLTWEEANGAIPKGYAVIFLNGDENKCAIGNLRMVSRGELAILNHCYDWKNTLIEQRDTVLLLARTSTFLDVSNEVRAWNLLRTVLRP